MASRSRAGQLGGVRLQGAVHGGGVIGEGGPDLVTVDRLGDRRAAVPDRVGNVLQAGIVRAEDGHERVPQFAGRPCPAEPGGLGDLAELLPYCQRSSGVPPSRQNTRSCSCHISPPRAVRRPGGCDSRGAPVPPWWAVSGRGGDSSSARSSIQSSSWSAVSSLTLMPPICGITF
jgi:hypothetical protein